jgi:hypothetical protein
MRGVIFYSLLIFSLVFLLQCSRKTAVVATNDSAYSEDLSPNRPQVHDYVSPEPYSSLRQNKEVKEPQLDVTDEVGIILDSMTEVNKRTQFSQYTIQVHTGSIREAAEAARLELYRLLPESKPVLEFVPPLYKVKVGKYFSQIEAYQTLLKLKEQFPNAIVVPERVYFK